MWICATPLFAQKPVHLQIIPVDAAAYNDHADMFSLYQSYPSMTACDKYLSQLPLSLRLKGFISCSLDSISHSDSLVKAFLFLGKKYQWKRVSVHPSDLRLLAQLGFSPENFERQHFPYAQFDQASNALLDYFSDNGYPFARILLDSVLLDHDKLSAVLVIHKGALYNIDSINVVGTAKLSQAFLHRYLNFSPDEPYNLHKLQAIDRLLQNLPYVQELRPADITMMNVGGILNLYLDKKQTNEIDAIIGFQPANGSLGGKLRLTGQVNLHLENAFGNGETVGINWQQLQPQSPQLNLQFEKPYLFKSPFGVDLSFNLYKQDSAYVNVDAHIGATYQLSQNQSGKVFLRLTSSRMLDVDTSQVIATHQLPPVIDESAANIGFGYNFYNTDYRLNPRRGNEFSATILAGDKRIRKNNSITQLQSENFDFSQLYDSLQLRSYQIKLNLSAAHYLPLGKFSVLKIAANAGLYQSPSIFNNELFLIGGYNLLRGFDENSIYANAYGIGTLEYRYLIGRNSYFFGFSDFGASQFKNNLVKTDDRYLSFGLGMTFETKAGILRFAIASGKDKENNFGLNRAKVHIGYTALF